MGNLTSIQQLKSLTSLRFFAAFKVVLYHVGRLISPAEGFDSFAGIGYVGVTFFFVLSGVVLTWTYRTGDKAAKFYGRRFARVWPLHAFTTVAAIAFSVAVDRPQNPAALAAIFPMLHAFVPSPGIYFAYNAPSWTLSCEAFFYLVFPCSSSGRCG